MRLLALLSGLMGLVVEPRHHLTAPKLDPRGSPTLEGQCAFDPSRSVPGWSWSDEAAQLLGEMAQWWRIPLPSDVNICPCDLRRAAGDRVLGKSELVSTKMSPDSCRRVRGGACCAFRIGVERLRAHLEKHAGSVLDALAQ
jgi:hypothetical protein